MGTLVVVGIFFSALFGYSDPEFPERLGFFIVLSATSGMISLAITRHANRVRQPRNRKILQRYYLAWNVFISLLTLSISWILLGLNKSVFGLIGPGALLGGFGAFVYAMLNRPPGGSIPIWRVAFRKPFDKYLMGLFLWQNLVVFWVIILLIRIFILK